MSGLPPDITPAEVHEAFREHVLRGTYITPNFDEPTGLYEEQYTQALFIAFAKGVSWWILRNCKEA